LEENLFFLVIRNIFLFFQGGGKTLAYLVPLIESLLQWKSSNRLVQVENAPFAIILAPTRELVAQIEVRNQYTFIG
jgi:superfamily II DNA/RNA helicase